MHKITRGLAALLVGALAAFAPAAAAQATEVKLKGQASACTPDGWTATWTFTNKSAVKVKVVTALSSSPRGVASSVPLPVVLDDKQSVTFTSSVPVNLRKATLLVEYRHKTANGWTDKRSEVDHVRTCCPSTPPTGEPSTPPSDNPTPPASEEPSTPPSDNPSTPPGEDPDPDPSEEPSTPPSSNPPSDDPTSPPDDDPTQPPTEPVGNKLPLTGAPVVGLAVTGIGLLAAGAGALLLMRRRRQRFEA